MARKIEVDVPEDDGQRFYRTLRDAFGYDCHIHESSPPEDTGKVLKHYLIWAVLLVCTVASAVVLL